MYWWYNDSSTKKREVMHSSKHFHCQVFTLGALTASWQLCFLSCALERERIRESELEKTFQNLSVYSPDKCTTVHLDCVPYDPHTKWLGQSDKRRIFQYCKLIFRKLQLVTNCISVQNSGHDLFTDWSSCQFHGNMRSLNQELGL